MVALFLSLILAHLVGDFLLQPTTWVKDKKKKKIKSKYLYYHVGLHFLLLLITTQFESNYFLGIVIVVLSHFGIDCAKLYFEKKKTEKLWFFADQLLHLLVIAIVVYCYFPYQIPISNLYSQENLALITALVLVTYVSAIVLKVLLSKWSDQLIKTDDTNNAGKYIGILERLFIFFFVVMNFWEGIGFLLAAKSIFRFGDLKESKDVRLTEYILIGTLLSFGLGILCAMLYRGFLV
jgi:protein-S-isoprenylcysteine O-methyltransferase Ste14